MTIMEADLHQLKINDPFLGQYQRLVRDVVIPYQWDALNDRVAEAEPSHAIANFRIAAGLVQGEFYGMVFQDSDVAKWLEAVAWSLCQKPDAELEKTADEVIELVAAAQCEDGYLNTYFTVKAPAERWTNLAECHELYCAGHMIEAGVVFPGNRKAPPAGRGVQAGGSYRQRVWPGRKPAARLPWPPGNRAGADAAVRRHAGAALSQSGEILY